eukprot:symbB.v1.2.029442.t1/scaffold3221.1/size60844/1
MDKATAPLPTTLLAKRRTRRCQFYGFVGGRDALDKSFTHLSADRGRRKSEAGRGMLQCSLGTQWQLALHLFTQMKIWKLEPNVITCNAVISCCEKGLQWTAALIMLDTMTSPDVVTYTAAMSCFEKSQQWSTALDLFQHVNLEAFNGSLLETAAGRRGLQRIRANVFTYNSVICACGKGSQWQLALHFFAQMDLVRLPPDSLQWQLALQIFDEMRSTQDLTVITYGAVLTACAAGSA